MHSVLAGLVMVELSQSPAAGLATMVMADFGAEVVWFEYGGEGDDYRVWHRGKKRVPVNLALGSERAQSQADAIREHIFASADVFVTDLSVQRLAELGLDWPALCSVRPDLVHAEVSAFGDDNPFGARDEGRRGTHPWYVYRCVK